MASDSNEDVIVPVDSTGVGPVCIDAIDEVSAVVVAV